MIGVVWLGTLLGVGAALSVGPIFVTITSTAAVRGFGASMRVITGSALADLIPVIPALGFAWVVSAIAQATLWIGLTGACYFGYLGVAAIREAVRLRH